MATRTPSRVDAHVVTMRRRAEMPRHRLLLLLLLMLVVMVMM